MQFRIYLQLYLQLFTNIVRIKFSAICKNLRLYLQLCANIVAVIRSFLQWYLVSWYHRYLQLYLQLYLKLSVSWYYVKTILRHDMVLRYYRMTVLQKYVITVIRQYSLCCTKVLHITVLRYCGMSLFFYSELERPF